VDSVLQQAGTAKLPRVNRVLLVGNKISPGNPVKKSDGTTVRALWGELAWQLGGKGAFARVAADDEKATSPGDVLRELFNEHGPCLVLIDEWVAYARQLHRAAGDELRAVAPADGAGPRPAVAITSRSSSSSRTSAGTCTCRG
jgi:predicted AAA+ superfamily ATPase